MNQEATKKRKIRRMRISNRISIKILMMRVECPQMFALRRQKNEKQRNIFVINRKSFRPSIMI